MKYFNLDKSFYKNKRILDVGCGPRGSLEWDDMALERVGLDPSTINRSEPSPNSM